MVDMSVDKLWGRRLEINRKEKKMRKLPLILLLHLSISALKCWSQTDGLLLFGIGADEITLINHFNSSNGNQERSQFSVGADYAIGTCDYKITDDLSSINLLKVDRYKGFSYSRKYIISIDDAAMVSMEIKDISWPENCRFKIFTPEKDYSDVLEEPTSDFQFSTPYLDTKLIIIEFVSPSEANFDLCLFTIDRVSVFIDNSERAVGDIYPISCADSFLGLANYQNSAVSLTINGYLCSGVVVSNPYDPADVSGDVLYVLTATHSIIDGNYDQNPCLTQTYSQQVFNNATAIVGKRKVLRRSADCIDLSMSELRDPWFDSFSRWRSMDVVAYNYVSAFSNAGCDGNDIALIKFTDKRRNGDIDKIPVNVDTNSVPANVTDQLFTLHYNNYPEVAYNYPDPNCTQTHAAESPFLQYCDAGPQHAIAANSKFYLQQTRDGNVNGGSSGAGLYRRLPNGTVSINGIMSKTRFLDNSGANVHCPNVGVNQATYYGQTSLCFSNSNTPVFGTFAQILSCSGSRDVCDEIVIEDGNPISPLISEGDVEMIDHGDGDGCFEDGEVIEIKFSVVNLRNSIVDDVWLRCDALSDHFSTTEGTTVFQGEIYPNETEEVSVFGLIYDVENVNSIGVVRLNFVGFSEDYSFEIYFPCNPNGGSNDCFLDWDHNYEGDIRYPANYNNTRTVNITHFNPEFLISNGDDRLQRGEMVRMRYQVELRGFPNDSYYKNWVQPSSNMYPHNLDLSFNFVNDEELDQYTRFSGNLTVNVEYEICMYDNPDYYTSLQPNATVVFCDDNFIRHMIGAGEGLLVSSYGEFNPLEIAYESRDWGDGDQLLDNYEPSQIKLNMGNPFGQTSECNYQITAMYRNYPDTDCQVSNTVTNLQIRQWGDGPIISELNEPRETPLGYYILEISFLPTNENIAAIHGYMYWMDDAFLADDNTVPEYTYPGPHDTQIQSLINSAADGSLLTISPGLRYESISVSERDLTIQCVDGNKFEIRSSDDIALDIENSNLSIRDMVVKNSFGTGVRAYNGTLNLDKCEVSHCNNHGMVVFDANVVIENSLFSANSDDGLTEIGGGAVRNNGGNVDMFNSLFEGNFSYGSGGAINSDFVLNVHGCTFRWNGSKYDDESELPATGGAIYATRYFTIEGIDGVHSEFYENGCGQLGYSNDLFLEHDIVPMSIGDCKFNNSMQLLNARVNLNNVVTNSGGCIYLTDDGNHVANAYNLDHVTSAVIVQDGVDLSIENSIIYELRNLQYNTISSVNAENSCFPMYVSSINGSGNVNLLTEDIKFVDNGNRELRWDSPCLDAAIGEVEFDDSSPDMGWKPKYMPIELSDVASTELLSRGYYNVSQTQVFSREDLNVPAGTVFKIADGKSLTLTSSSGTNFTIGSQDGPRTSIVSGYHDGERASRVTFSGGLSSSPKNSSIKGTLFKYSPDHGYNFQYLRNIKINPDLTHGGEIEFVSLLGGSINLVYCDNSEVSYIDFRPDGGPSNEMPGKLRVLWGDVKLLNNSFPNSDGTGQSSPLWLYQNQGSLVQVNLFEEQNSTGPKCSLEYGYVGLIGNVFANCNDVAISMSNCDVEMAKFAGNYFTSVGVSNQNSLIEMNKGRLDLHCGYNRFVAPSVSTSVPFIHDPRSLIAPVRDDWSKNYWGRAIAEPIQCDAVNQYLPLYADGSNCLGQYDPLVIFCPQTEDEPMELWNLGQQAEIEGKMSSAVWYYGEILRLYPTSKPAPKALARLKELGKAKEDVAGDSKACLLVGSQAALAQEDTWLSAMELCAAQCVEAKSGDRLDALSVLDSLIQLGDPQMTPIAIMSQQEIATYPPQGGLSGLTDEEKLALQLSFDCALENLMANVSSYIDPALPEVALPKSFEIKRVYPNPFNPRTTIDLTIPVHGVVRVALFNVLGQLVHVIHDGELKAGQHQMSLDGSNLASGVYMIRAQQGDEVSTQKVLLLK